MDEKENNLELFLKKVSNLARERKSTPMSKEESKEIISNLFNDVDLDNLSDSILSMVLFEYINFLIEDSDELEFLFNNVTECELNYSLRYFVKNNTEKIVNLFSEIGKKIILSKKNKPVKHLFCYTNSSNIIC